MEAKKKGHMVILRREGAVAWTYRCHIMAIKVRMTGEIQERVQKSLSKVIASAIILA